MNIYKKLSFVQHKLKAPKSQFNKFGGYNFRNCEDIIEAVKPLLFSQGLVLALTDEIRQIGERYYVAAKAMVIDVQDGEKHCVEAFAREEEQKKGMDSSQITGSSSSYARKYALNGLFAIDDTKDSDTTNTHGKEEPKNRNVEKPKEKTPRELLIERLNELGIDVNAYAAANGLSNKTTPERFMELLEELG